MIRLNLQLFAGEKTEKATPKKREEARKKGQVARSQEFGQAAVLMAGLLTLKFMGGTFVGQLTDLMRKTFSGNLAAMNLTPSSVMSLFLQMLWLLATLVLPIMGVVFAVGLLVSYLQVGTLFSWKPLMPDLKRINPIEGFKRIFSARTFVELLKSLLKMLFIGLLVYSELMNDWAQISQLGEMDIVGMINVVGNLTFDVFWKVGLVMFALGLFDLLYQRYEYAKSLRMSKQEVKEEYKQMEGNPEIKMKIKERQRAMALRRMMADIPKADVVITNPTHFAVAIRYNPDEMEAPQVIAKGIDELAQRIKKVAKEAEVVLVENRPLAQTLYKTVEIGESIPAELFQAVAEVLAYVYRLKGKV